MIACRTMQHEAELRRLLLFTECTELEFMRVKHWLQLSSPTSELQEKVDACLKCLFDSDRNDRWWTICGCLTTITRDNKDSGRIILDCLYGSPQHANVLNSERLLRYEAAHFYGLLRRLSEIVLSANDSSSFENAYFVGLFTTAETALAAFCNAPPAVNNLDCLPNAEQYAFLELLKWLVLLNDYADTFVREKSASTDNCLLNENRLEFSVTCLRNAESPQISRLLENEFAEYRSCTRRAHALLFLNSTAIFSASFRSNWKTLRATSDVEILKMRTDDCGTMEQAIDRLLHVLNCCTNSLPSSNCAQQLLELMAEHDYYLSATLFCLLHIYCDIEALAMDGSEKLAIFRSQFEPVLIFYKLVHNVLAEDSKILVDWLTDAQFPHFMLYFMSFLKYVQRCMLAASQNCSAKCNDKQNYPSTIVQILQSINKSLNSIAHSLESDSEATSRECTALKFTGKQQPVNLRPLLASLQRTLNALLTA